MSLGKVIPKSPLKDMPIKSKVPLKPQAVVLHQCYMWEWNLLSPNNHKIQSLSLQKSQLTFIFSSILCCCIISVTHCFMALFPS